MNKDNLFKFWVPADFEKSKSKEGKIEMKIKGIASTNDEDADGEYLNPTGFDLGLFKKSGVFNWHHRSKDNPEAIIGEPTDAKITNKGLYVEGYLYPDSDMAKKVFKAAEVLQKNSKTRRLGFSIEGKVLERDDVNPKIVKKALITGCAITHLPKNPNTLLEIMKGEYEEAYPEDNSTLNTHTTGKPLKKESLLGGHKRKKVKTPLVDSNGKLSKSQIFDYLFLLNPELTSLEAVELYDEITKSLNENNNKMKETKKKVEATKEGVATVEEVNKALAELGLDSMEKGGDDEEEEIEEEDEFSSQEEEVVEEDEEEIEEEEEEGTEKGEDEDEEDEEDEEEEEEEEEPKKKVAKKEIKKAKTEKESEPFLSQILKAIDDNEINTSQRFKSLAILSKAILEQNEILKSRLDEMETQFDEFLGAEQQPKSKVVKSYREKEGFEKGGEGRKDDAKCIDLKDKKKLLEVLDEHAFSKGYDEDFSKSLTLVEAGGLPTENAISKLRTAGYTFKK